ncbi:TIGR04282 family arsenosugar biosynthesis glycosyltransferase [Magnetococcus sp. PR-3]|uniref:TIGR04282 family arsenosugar biosynthesis glycosyltransferase n=1 Tax=Magnetococcus sp. PR-3 TaxID=3120355 RepID=UPI002FCE5194
MRLNLALMARVPQLGKVKTRLAATLGDQTALHAHCTLLKHVAKQLHAWPGSLTLWATPSAEHPLFEQLFPTAQRSLQPQGDLGERLMHAVDSGLQQADGVVLLGADAASVTPALLLQAAQALLTHDVVMAPAEDGGYILLGVKQCVPSLFQQITWGGEAVAQQTRQAIVKQGLTLWESEPQWDVDTPEDWSRFLQNFQPN